jgi:molybdenum cofactor cytidylyltransferase
MADPTPRPAAGRLSAVVLAAGLSSRMRGKNKLLLGFRGTPVVRRCVTAALGHGFAEVVVVTGHEAPAVLEALRGLPVRIAHNDRYAEGQMTSVRRGLAALSGPSADVAGVMVCLSDQPSLTTDDVDTIATAFLARPDCAVLVPTFAGARGNPIVLARKSIDDILLRGGNFGCKQFVSKNADIVETFVMPNDHVLVDLDSPEDYAALCAAPAPTSPEVG